MPKLEQLDIGETSGVDHPAHLTEGWLMMKSADLDTLLKEQMRTCPQCGEAVGDQEGYCPHCGRQVAKAERPLSAIERVARLRVLHKALGEVLDEGGSMPNDAVPQEVAEFLEESEAPEGIRKAVEAAFAPPEPEGEDALLKDVPEAVRKMLETERAARVELEKAVEAERTRRETEDAVAKSRDWSIIGVDAAEFGPVLQALRKENPDVAEDVEAVLDGASKVAETSELFRTVGKSTSGTGDVEGRLEAMTAERMTKGLDHASAYAEVLESPEGARLYAEHRREKEGSR
jgi:hypothetical protein